MLSVVTLDDQNQIPVTLHQDAANGKRWLISATGLRGVAGLRINHRVKSQRAGGLNETKFEDGRQITLVGEIMSQVSIEDAFNEFGLIAAPIVQTLDVGPALLKWQEGSGAVNLVPDPSFEYDTIGVAPTGAATSGYGALNPGATLSVVTTPTLVGSRALQVVTTNALASEGVAILIPGTFLVGVAYQVGIPIRGNDGGEVISLGAASLSTGDFQGSSANLTTAYQRLTFTYTPVATHTDFYLYVRSSSAVAMTFFIDAIMVAAGSVLPAYFDGDSPGCEWTRTPGNSTSRSGHALQRLVKLDGDFDPPIQDGQAVLSYQAQFFAEDPRAYSQTLQTVTSSPVVLQGGGMTFNKMFPFTFASSGGGTVTFTNSGNRSTPPIFRILGDCVNPQIVLTGTGQRLVFNGEVPAGSYLEVDAAKRTVKLNGTTNRLNFYDGANSTWFDLPSGVSNLQLTCASSSDGNAALTVIGRSAFA